MNQSEPVRIEYDDEERPARRLSGRTAAVVTVVCALVSCFVLYAVFRPLPQGSQYYLTLFLTIVLPLVFLGYRGGSTPPAGRRAAGPAGGTAQDDAGRGGPGPSGTRSGDTGSSGTGSSDTGSDGRGADDAVPGAQGSGEQAPDAREGARGGTTAQEPAGGAAGVTARATATGPATTGPATTRPTTTRQDMTRQVAAGAATARATDNPNPLDWLLAVLAVVAAGYPLLGFDEFLERRPAPSMLDVVMGLVLLALVLEACRRATGWWLPVICLGFLTYAYYGGYLPVDWPIAHVGFNVDEIVAQLYMGTSGIYSVPLDVAATYIVLFTIYGAVLEMSGASKFFIDLSFAAFGRTRTAPGRTVTLAGFLLGTVSGSGTATAVSLGTVSWPILRRAGYPREQAGGVLAATGIGAILSPPTLGAAAFIIAELLQTSYLTVLGYALIPTVLYYSGIIIAIEIDARKQSLTGGSENFREGGGALRLFLRFGYHFLSLFLIVFFMALGLSAFTAVVYATALQFVLSFLDREHRLGPRRLFATLAAGTRNAVPVVSVCAAAGIIVAVVTQSGLGFSLASIIVDAARSIAEHPTAVLLLTALFAAVAVAVLGLAVPVTASFIIAAVIIAPALQQAGVERPEAYLFVFYYAVLSEVSPPTALAAVASSAITGGDPIRTMWATWRYTLPAFLVPFAFVLTDNGSHLLARGEPGGILWTAAVSLVAVAALGVATGGWLAGPANVVERVLAGAAALLLLYLEPVTLGVGGALLAVAVVGHLLRRLLPRRPPRNDHGRVVI